MIGEIVGLVLAIVAAVLLYKLVRGLAGLLVNAVAGIVVLWLLDLFLSPPVAINLWSVLIAAIGGLPGVLIVIVLHFLGLAF
ncbi:MAG TPA: pro-sigmaK processing inhibitor BofA family protein [Methanoregulaceae archaeon]|nr:pro-sigmaK processing inhibitor BofA family protein [Methanoregulaceae archaeon]HQJ88274.1 pro-sigmaK processing inhibitor BofA family protein [Methanoregulaceae archaeon]